MSTPPGALTWQSAAERNRKLRAWRRAVSRGFGEKRAIIVAWALADLFNATTGFAYPGNERLAAETGLRVNKVQEALAMLEQGGAIIRVVATTRWRHIFPAAAILQLTPNLGVSAHPLSEGVQNLISLTEREKEPESVRGRAHASGREIEQNQARENTAVGERSWRPGAKAYEFGRGFDFNDDEIANMLEHFKDHMAYTRRRCSLEGWRKRRPCQT
jgi:Helix-turn-helix domain